MDNSDLVALYIHIPFCPSKCHYCSFAVITDHTLYEAYLTALKEELRSTVKVIQEKGRRVHTIYFGGGTPSTLKIEDIKEILNIALIEKGITPLPTERSASEAEVQGVTQAQTSTALCPAQSIIEEISFEVNPEHVTKDYIENMKNLGITRISIGIQSLEEKVLQKAGRKHTKQAALHALTILQKSGIPFNVDLIIGLPESSKKSFIQTLEHILTFSPSHISAYFLTIEPGTPFQLLPEKDLIQEEEQVETFELMKKILQQHDFSQYEISNWAKQDHESKHNLMYWRGKEFLGVGLGASSFFEGKRWSNFQNMKLYLQKKEKINTTSVELLSPNDMAESYLMHSLRLAEGCNSMYLKTLCEESFFQRLDKKIQHACSLGYLTPTRRGFTIPQQERLFHNHIISFLLT